jgi:adenylate kinase
MIGPPGVGKGTQGAMIAAHFGVPRVVMGDVLRDYATHRTRLGRAVKAHLDRGNLVPDEIVLDVVRHALIAAKVAGGGYVLDGVPRTKAQALAGYQIARALGMAADVALHLHADDAEVTRRLRARAAIEHRSDDADEVIRRRLALYHQQAPAILAWYTRRGIVVSVDAMRPAQQVGRDILAALNGRRRAVHEVRLAA